MKYPTIANAALKGIALVTALSLTACGGSDSDSPEPAPGPGGTTTYNLSGSIDNLKRGDLTVSATASGSTESHTFTNETSFSFDTDFPAGTAVTLEITAQPTGQECELSQSSLTINSNVTNLAITCDDLEYAVSGTITGDAPASFNLVVTGDRSITVPLSGNEPFTIASDFIYEQAIALSIGDTTGYECTVAPESLTVTDTVSDVVVACTSIGSVSGLVTNFISGEVAANVSVTAYAFVNGDEVPFGTVMSDDNGLYEMLGVDTTDTFYIRASSPDYVVDVESHIANGTADRVLNLTVLPVGYSATFAATDALAMGSSATATVNIVEIPASTLVTGTGAAPTGDVIATLTVIDPSLYVEAMPGLYTTSNSETGAIEPIESFGAFSLTLTDADGNDLDLTDGTSATVRIPLASGAVNPPATIPLYYFDESSALWVEEGEATLTTVDGGQYYVGTVTHFTTWNADQVYNTVNVLGCVVTTDGEPLANVQVLSEGTSYTGRSSSYTDSEGNFTLPVRMNSQLLVFARATGQTNTVALVTGSVDSQIPNCLVIGDSTAIVKLTWGANPRDLDTHLTGPTEGSDSRFRVYYGNQDETIGNVTINLDVDDTSSYGPEVLTIPSFVLPGRYRYSVHHYSGSETIFASPTRVELRLNDRVYVFNPVEDVDSSSSDFEMWVVFDLIVDDELNVSVVEINQHTTYSGAETLGVENFSGSKFSAEQVQPLPAKQY